MSPNLCPLICPPLSVLGKGEDGSTLDPTIRVVFPEDDSVLLRNALVAVHNDLYDYNIDLEVYMHNPKFEERRVEI